MVALLAAGEEEAIPSTADVGGTSQMSPGPGSQLGLVMRKQLKRNIGTGQSIILLRNTVQQL